MSSSRNKYLPSDITSFLNHYKSSRPLINPPTANLTFYKNKTPALPSRNSIEALQNKLRKNYSELESNHSFIQWLFPIKEQGMNYQSQPLNDLEIQGIISDEKAMNYFKESYNIILDFYGMKLIDVTTGQIGRNTSSDTNDDLNPTPSSSSYKRRYQNLQTSSHNYLRITRILKSLSEFGLESYNAPLLLFFLYEQSSNNLLANSSLVNSMDHYWKYCIRNDEERDYVSEMIDGVRDGKRSWTEEDYVKAIKRRSEIGSFCEEEKEEVVEETKVE